MSPTPTDVLNAVKASGVVYKLVSGWDDPKIAASGNWTPVGVLEHHTSGVDSLSWVIHDNYYPIRACHFLVNRDGMVNVIYSLKCYHAGAGGPTQVGATLVPQDLGNGYFYGIEIESLGTSLDNSGANGYTDAQVIAASKLSAALLNMMKAPTSAAMNHKDYAPGRKTDTLLSKEFWQAKIQAYRTPSAPEEIVTPQDIDAIAHAVWNTTYTDPIDGKPASTASILLRARIDSHNAINAVPPATGAAISDADIERLAKAVLDEQAARLQS